MPKALTRATADIAVSDLRFMVLPAAELPREVSEFVTLRADNLDNEAMARYALGNRTPSEVRATGRVGGYLREFSAPLPAFLVREGFDLVAATVVHLFLNAEASARWITEVFLDEFEGHAGEEVEQGHRLLKVERFAPEGLSDLAVGLRTLQRGPSGLVSSSVVDFRVGRLLGVAFVVTAGDVRREELVIRLARGLEERMVRVVLDAA